MKYRKKPVVVDAWHFDGSKENAIKLSKLARNIHAHPNLSNDEYHLFIPTLEGSMKLRKGDYLIKGIAGEFYPCKPDIFEQTYEIVEE